MASAGAAGSSTGDSSGSGGGFQLVRKGARPRRRVSIQRQSSPAPSRLDIVAAVMRAKDDSGIIDYAETVVEGILRDVVCVDMICYGIGLFGTCFTARHQLALLLHISAAKQVRQVLVYDPVLRGEEKAALEVLGCATIPENELCRRKVHVHTVFYMPHCGRSLYNNLLWANWSPLNLSKLTLLGNSFQSYLERTPQKKINEADSYIFKAMEFCQEKALPPYIEPTIFNDLSVHSFPLERLLSAPPSLWIPRPPPPPDLSDPELIT